MTGGIFNVRPPSVEKLANNLLETGLPKPLCVDIARQAIADGKPDSALERAEIMAKNILRPVVNATGVLLHTNMGRAPYEFRQPLGYTNLELDLESGERGSRQDHIASLFARLAGAEAGLVVNNCAAAVTLILAALVGESGESSGVVVSRGELVEIGGGFRVPEVITSAGAELIEVGTTNRTRLKDYEKGIKKHNGKICLKVHQSNYTLKGFTESVSTSDLAKLSVPLVVDLGSGLIDAACPWLTSGQPKWLVQEPAARQTLEAGADIVAFSGDKLLGGPQAGIIVGKAELIEKCSAHPLARAFRIGGLSVAALLDVALKYLNQEGEKIPFWQMASATPEELEARVDEVLEKVGSDKFEKTGCSSVTGGGTLPDVEIPSFGIKTLRDINESLRQFSTPIISRVQDDFTILDFRTIFPEQDQLVIQSLKSQQ